MMKKSPEVFNKAKCDGKEGEDNLVITDATKANRSSNKIFREHLHDKLEKLGSQPDMKPAHNKVTSGFQAFRQTRSPVAGLELISEA
ncbi:hypothetical protein PoB_005842100 [Plakobranchus ocellatus]|uniref:Uncharacterized protein n=1 Tax=Plakobranchus ocellatus TaxID=259542 RepID=A0AAV4C9B7_9GAST|nr:hypothetical protein PoB_005842100 [Plakobranchus ocellatus]